ncbi:uncharacterized protein [Macrobrachium rosenbergii]|uniref:uncharacterized protein n=1 Tax=Macrobrachium rosenbergii TaxID=79674 RepID=UPI0034D5F687
MEMNEFDKNFIRSLTIGLTKKLNLEAAADPGLTSCEKLWVDSSLDQTAAATKAARIIYKRFNKKSSNAVRNWMANGAYAVIFGGLVAIGPVDGKEDGDWLNTAQGDMASVEDTRAILNPNMVKSCVTLALAGKINYYKMNHHTGQGCAQGYTKSVMTKVFGQHKSVDERVEDEDNRKKIMHTISHWCSTLLVLGSTMPLRYAQATPLRDIHPVNKNWLYKIRPTEYIQITTSPPAGAGAVGIEKAIAGMLASNMMFYLFPDPQGLSQVMDRFDTIVQNPFIYHVRSHYLTGFSKRALKPEVLGMLVSWVREFCPNSTVAKSPYCKANVGFRDWRDYKYNDYDDAWWVECRFVKDRMPTDFKNKPVDEQVDAFINAGLQVSLRTMPNKTLFEILGKLGKPQAMIRKAAENAAAIRKVLKQTPDEYTYETFLAESAGVPLQSAEAPAVVHHGPAPSSPIAGTSGIHDGHLHPTDDEEIPSRRPRVEEDLSSDVGFEPSTVAEGPRVEEDLSSDVGFEPSTVAEEGPRVEEDLSSDVGFEPSTVAEEGPRVEEDLSSDVGFEPSTVAEEGPRVEEDLSSDVGFEPSTVAEEGVTGDSSWEDMLAISLRPVGDT